MNLRRTNDVYLAAYLMLMGHPLSHVEPEPRDPGRLTFFFEDGPGVMKDLETFRERKAVVELYAFVQRVRELKHLARVNRRASTA